MSDLFNSKADYLDDRTQLIMHGYFHQYSSYIIPLDIIHLTTLFVDDHFMLIRGGHQWYIEGDLLTQMKSASRTQKFVSNRFKICELEWQIEIYPNGKKNDDESSVKVYIKLLSLPSSWKHFFARIRVICNETKTSFTWISKFVKNYKAGWHDNSMRLEEIQHLEKLSFTVSATILKIILNDNDQILYKKKTTKPINASINWKINEEILNKIKVAHNGKRFESPIYNDVWCLRIIPNSSKQEDKGWCQISLQLCGPLPVHVQNMKINWKMTVIMVRFRTETEGEKQDIVNTNDTKRFVGDKNNSYNWGRKKLEFERIQQCDSMVINAEIKVLDEDVATTRWNKFVDDEEEKNIHDRYEKRFEVIEKQLQVIMMKLEELIVLPQSDHKRDEEGKDEVDVFVDGEKVEEWLKDTVRLPQYYRVLMDQGFDDMESIGDITLDDLIKVGIDKIGHQKKILKYVQKLNDI